MWSSAAAWLHGPGIGPKMLDPWQTVEMCAHAGRVRCLKVRNLGLPALAKPAAGYRNPNHEQQQRQGVRDGPCLFPSLTMAAGGGPSRYFGHDSEELDVWRNLVLLRCLLKDMLLKTHLVRSIKGVDHTFHPPSRKPNV